MFHSNDDLPTRRSDETAAEMAAETAGAPADQSPTADTAGGVASDNDAIEAGAHESAEPSFPEDLAMDASIESGAAAQADAATPADEPSQDPGAPTWPPAPSGWSDAITSTDGPHYWDRLLSSERDRVRRYHRPATIVFIEVANLERLAELWGDDVAAQSLVRVGRTVMREIRSSDHAARIDVSRFAVFLPETNEIAAINFVERVRAAIDASLGLMAETIHVGIGWASPAEADLDVALELAESRLVADLTANA
jgi:diguanylate cyclase (GGDEF)-like protein